MKTIIITGASAGVGKACALKLSSEYEYVALCSRNHDRGLEEVKGAILSASNISPQVELFSGDVSDFDFVYAMVEKVYRQTGSIDALINNAGISRVGLLMDMSIEEWNEIVSINLTSVFNTCKCVIPHMVHVKSGKIINISSVWGNAGASCEVAYSATKGGINSFTRALAKELAPSNISVNAVALGAIDTRMNSNLSEEDKLGLCEEIPAGRMASPEEAAEFISTILKSPGYFTGEVIKFDGAWI